MLPIALALRAARAQSTDDEPVEEDDIDVPSSDSDKKTGDDWGFGQPKPALRLDEDDGAMTDFVAEERKKPPPPDHWHLDPTGKVPLSDDFDIQVVAYNERWIVFELPVLVANDRASFAQQHPGGILVVGEVTSGAHRVVLQQAVTPDGVLEAAPTLVFLKAALPSPVPAGDVRFLVKVGELPAPPPAPDPAAPKSAKPPPPPPPPPPPRDRYARTTVFMRK